MNLVPDFGARRVQTGIVARFVWRAAIST